MTTSLFVDAKHTELYKAFRPGYPNEIYEGILKYYFEKNDINDINEKIPLALDVACGSGQATVELSHYCERVIGIDASQNQIKHASAKNNIEYKHSPAENLEFLSANSVDLVTVATALHWLDVDAFFKEVDRILKPSGVLSIWCTGFPLLLNSRATEVFEKFHQKDLHGYWTDRIDLVTSNYEIILDKFPYHETRKRCIIEYVKDLSIIQFVNLIETWSSCQKYREANGDENLKSLLKRLTQDLASCYCNESEQNAVDFHQDYASNKIITVKWMLHLHLMKKY